MSINKYFLSSLITLFGIIFVILILSINYIEEKENELLEKKYKTYTSNMQDKILSLIQKKQNATLAFTIALTENKDLLKIFTNNNYDPKLDELSYKLREQSDFKNVWFQIINKDGVSVYRSWSDKKNDKLNSLRGDVKDLILNKKIKSSISVGKFDITFKAMVPLYQDNEFVGILESITHFNSISRGLRISDQIEPIIVVEEKFTKQLEKNAYTKIFIQNHYVANLSVDKNLLKYLETQNVKDFLKIDTYIIKDEKIVVNTPIMVNDKKLANFLIFKDLKSIDISDISEFKKRSYIYLSIFLVLLSLILFIIGYYSYSKELKDLYEKLNKKREELDDLNTSLQKTVEDEVSKNYEKNKLLFQQSKMAAMGEMIGNIAHQWRQPLSIVTISASSIKLKKQLGLEDKEAELEALDTIINSANYLSNTVDDFRNYFLPNRQTSEFSTNKLIEKVLNLITLDYKNKNIQIIKNIEDHTINNYENELIQVFLNILNNANDELLKNDNKDKFIFIDSYKKDENIIIEIKDNAGGIDETIIDRIFEPYFTTKHKSRGTGIGLYMCGEIISKHVNGEIKASNKEYIYRNKSYKGALFTLSIPIK